MRRSLLVLAAAVLAACPRPSPSTGASASTKPRALAVSDPAPIAILGGKGEARILLDRTTVGLAEGALTDVRMEPGTSLPLHVHPHTVEILCMIEGEGDLTVSGQVEHAGPGDVLVIPPGVVHGFVAGGTRVRGVQFYAPGGPEQRFRGAASDESVKPEESSVPDRGNARVIAMTDTVLREREDHRQYRYLVEGQEAAGRKLDLLWIKIPAGKPADIHAHDDVSELVYVLSGEGTANVGDDAYPVKAGSAYWTPRGFQAGLATKTEMEILILVVS
ncbi:MAG: cupin domain-containing protein [Acidobacteriota bacterium]